MSNTVDQPQVNLTSNNIGSGNNDNRMSAKSSLADIERQQQEAMLTATAAKQKQQTYTAIAQYNSSGAEQEKIQGKNLVQTGHAKEGMGFGMMGMGHVMMAMGMAIPGAQAMISSGVTMIGQGLQQVVMGKVDVSQGNQALARAQEKLEKATQNNILSQQEGKTVTKEISRSQLFEMKRALLEDMTQEIKPMLDKMGVDTKDMSEDQMGQWFDKMFEDGAKTAANGGVLETNLQDIEGKPMFKDGKGKDLTGTFFFIQDEGGDFYQVESTLDEEGNPVADSNGKPILDPNKSTKVEDPELNNYLKAQFMFADNASSMAEQMGISPEEFAQLAMKVNLTDIKNGTTPGPLKVTNEGGKIYLQQWDWENEVPIGPKTPMDEVSGGNFDRGDMESYQRGMDRSKNALEALGLQSGGTIFNYVNTSEELGYKPGGSESGDSINTLLGLGQDSDQFKKFAGISTVLDSTSSDDLPEGEA